MIEFIENVALWLPGIVAIIGGIVWGISLVNEQEWSEGNSEQ